MGERTATPHGRQDERATEKLNGALAARPGPPEDSHLPPPSDAEKRDVRLLASTFLQRPEVLRDAIEAGVDPRLLPLGCIEREVVSAVAALLEQGHTGYGLSRVRDVIVGWGRYPFAELAARLADLDDAFARSEDHARVTTDLLAAQDRRRVASELSRLSAELAAGASDPDDALEQVGRLRDRAAVRGELPDRGGLAAFAAAPAEPPDFVFEPLRRGQLAMLSGPAGTGKSWDALAIARGVTVGEQIYGAIATTQARVALVLTETPAWEFRSRVEALARANEWHRDASGAPSWLADLAGVLLKEDGRFHDITKGPTRRRLIRWVKRSGADLLIVDPLTHLMPGGNDADPKDNASLIEAIEELHRETGTTILAVHHDRKTASGAGRGKPDRAIDRARGGTRLTAFFDAVFSTLPDPNDDHLRQLCLGSGGGKVRSGRSVAPIWLRENDEGVPIPEEAPTRKGTTGGVRARREGILSIVRGACVSDAAEGVTVAEVAEALVRQGLPTAGRRTLKVDLDELAVGGFLERVPGTGTRGDRFMPGGDR